VRTRAVSLRKRKLEALWAELDRVEATDGLVHLAGELAERQALRAYDAVHLASAVSVADAELVLVSADGDLLTAAQSLGIATAAVGV
jgi:predicted nucleic acid-binding protein